MLKKWYIQWKTAQVNKRFKDRSLESVFTEIFESKTHWDATESVSGSGSNLANTKSLRKELPHFLKAHSIQSILDIPCGDFYWMQHLDWSTIRYIGGDIVEELIQENTKKHKTTNIEFLTLDICHSSLPKVDLIFCRDCLVHLSFEYIFQALNNMVESDASYLLLTHFPKQTQNQDIVSGNWRRLNFEKAPFNFSPPLQILEDKVVGSIDFQKTMGLWTTDQIKKTLR